MEILTEANFRRTGAFAPVPQMLSTKKRTHEDLKPKWPSHECRRGGTAQGQQMPSTETARQSSPGELRGSSATPGTRLRSVVEGWAEPRTTLGVPEVSVAVGTTLAVPEVPEAVGIAMTSALPLRGGRRSLGSSMSLPSLTTTPGSKTTG